MQSDFDLVRAEMEREAKRAAKLEQKVTVLLGGLQQRDTKLQSQLSELWDQVQKATMEHECFKVRRVGSFGIMSVGRDGLMRGDI